eukprot:gene8514-17555_t
MSAILLDWLNEDVGLSREVTSLEQDFVNGYLLAEILHHHNQVSDFSSFSDKNTPDATISNFCLLEPTMRHLGVCFNASIAAAVINGKKGVMKTMMYELRTVLESVKKRTVTSNGHGGHLKILRVIQTVKPSFDKTKATTFQTALRGLIDNPNEIRMARSIERYRQNKEEFRMSVTLGHSTALSQLEDDVQKIKTITKHRKVHDKEFLDAWDLINTKIWKDNQKIAKQRKEITIKVNLDTMKRKDLTSTYTRTLARNDTLASIDDFDARLRTEVFREDPKQTSNVNLAIKSVPAQPSKGIPKISYLDRDCLHASMVETQKAMKEHHEELLINQQIHGRRQRRFIRERESFHTDTLSYCAESDVMNQLLKLCSSEQLEAQMKNKIMLHKHVFNDNKKYRIWLINTREIHDNELLTEWRIEEAKREYHCIVKPRIFAQRERLDYYEQAQAAASRHGSLDIVFDIVDRILDVTFWVISCREVGLYSTNALVDDPLPEEMWKDAVLMFSSSIAVAQPWLALAPVNVSAVLPYYLSERPLCADSNWLYTRPFDGAIALAPTAITSSGEDMQVESHIEVDIAAYLSQLDCDAFVSSVADPAMDEVYNDATGSRPGSPAMSGAIVDELKTTTTKVKGEKAEKVESQKSKKNAAADTTEEVIVPTRSRHFLQPPDWMVNTPQFYILGEAIMNIRCASNPIPDDPLPVIKQPIFPYRIALFGISDELRNNVSTALQRAFGVVIIRVKDLVNKAFIAAGKLQEQPQESYSSLELLYLQVLNLLTQGECIHEDVYISLLLEEIHNLGKDKTRKGYVIEDFPNTLEDSRKFIQALSGIDYTIPKPNPLDLASPLVPPLPHIPKDYDMTKCGLDAVFYLESNPDQLVINKFGERIDLQTGSRVILTEDLLDSIQYLNTNTKANEPIDMYTMDLTMSLESAEDVRLFFENLNILHSLNIEDYETTEDLIDTAISIITDLGPNVIPEETGTEDELDSDKYPEDSDEMMGVVVAPPTAPSSLELQQQPQQQPQQHDKRSATNTNSHVGNISNSTGSNIASSSSRSMKATVFSGSYNALPLAAIAVTTDTSTPLTDLATEVVPVRPIEDTTKTHSIPRILADALGELWRVSENQSLQSCKRFYSALRDVRFQICQRRRALHDTLQMNLIRHEDRQSIFDEFRQEFNEIEDDFRFDSDCIAELQLRTQELRHYLWTLIENRKKETEVILRKFLNDGSAGLAIYRCQCEGVALLQAESNRFVAAINIILDIFYSLQKCDEMERFTSALEESAPLPVSESSTVVQGGKGTNKQAPPKEKKAVAKTPTRGKLEGDGAPRQPLGPTFLAPELAELPEPEVKHDEEEPEAVAEPASKSAKTKSKSKPTSTR